ncbi:DEAD/DEAH box helicase [Aquibacillus sp. 3ASR75-11]|uniref:RNA helicase n=1 Tax=Terrihalobacillus insolitus TaxID=2950438 RepID=A0A9X3WVM4_9BACI|nr:DEAD/DEAH box helicase [Terrihalobacillus insolitus]MDC3425653.1 DEAD/DEAH box helicase [Terrihalobacillus insolitus]
MTDFQMLGISSEQIEMLKELGIHTPTEVQRETIPVLLEKKDAIVQAQTGTGKTLAFLLPILERIDPEQTSVQALIVSPTRELARQITDDLTELLHKKKHVHALSIYGGQDIEHQLKKLKHVIHVVVATPGRLLDHIRRNTVDLSNIRMFVLDEADQMLHMGFLPDVEEVMQQLPSTRQSMLFSATMPQEIKHIANHYLIDPVDIQIMGKNITLEEVKQMVIETTDREKQNQLMTVLNQFHPFLAVIFCRTKRRVMKLNAALQMNGYEADELHGDLSQAKREKVMQRFRDMKIQYLVATDVAARGIDVEGITHVFNYDIPQDVESYIHRIGRTARAGGTGIAVTFVAPKDKQYLTIIERGIKTKIKKKTL